MSTDPKLRGLGRGLSALLGEDTGDGVPVSPRAPRSLPIEQLRPSRFQPRHGMDDGALRELAASIAEKGVLQPILVRRVADDPAAFEIIAGERRWRAAQLAGLQEVPVLVREIADEAALAMSLIENIQRENLNPLEEAAGIKRLIDEFSMTHQLAAEAVGRSRAAVSNLLRLLNLAAPVQEMLMHSRIDMGHARALLALDGAKQIATAEHIAYSALSVREAEALVKRVAHGKQKLLVKKADADVTRLQDELSEILGAQVRIQPGRDGAGVVSIHYHDLDQLDGLVATFKKRNANTA